MRSFIVAVTLIGLTTLVGCSTVQVSQDYDPAIDLSRYATWQWREAVQPKTGDLRADNPLLDQRIRHAVEDHLAGRNIRLSPSQPDFYLTYHLAIHPKIESESYPASVGVGSYYYPWYGGFGAETRIYQYDECQITIDFQAADTGNLLWRGSGVYRYRSYKTPEAAAEDTRKTIDKILAQFPPGVSR